MREFEPHLLQADKVEQHQEQNQKQEYKFIGSITIKTGCKLFAYDPDKDEINEVKISGGTSVDFMTGELADKKKAQYNPKFIYFQCINKKNAWRKLAQFRSGKYEVAEGFEQMKKEPLPQLF